MDDSGSLGEKAMPKGKQEHRSIFLENITFGRNTNDMEEGREQRRSTETGRDVRNEPRWGN